jgi:hypothetical protein
MIQPLRTLSESNPVLSATGWVHVLLLAALIIIAPFDSRTILGISPWIKPMKFSVSIVIYVWTLAWFLRYLANVRAVRRISWGVAISMFAEIFCIVLQAARGTTSHYNVATPLDAAIFGLMGLMVAVNTVLVAWMLLLFFRERPAIPPAYRWGIRLGLALFLFASAEGGIMIGHRAHTVGAADGGPGLPFVNWSTQHGDLRIAHFVGMHALQVLPLAGWFLSRYQRRRSVSYTVAFAFLYFSFALLLGIIAWQGHPAI